VPHVCLGSQNAKLTAGGHAAVEQRLVAAKSDHDAHDRYADHWARAVELDHGRGRCRHRSRRWLVATTNGSRPCGNGYVAVAPQREWKTPRQQLAAHALEDPRRDEPAAVKDVDDSAPACRPAGRTGCLERDEAGRPHVGQVDVADIDAGSSLPTYSRLRFTQSSRRSRRSEPSGCTTTSRAQFQIADERVDVKTMSRSARFSKAARNGLDGGEGGGDGEDELVGGTLTQVVERRP